jgi:tRNA nucleotidyltransferase (CCA-adding enzyme)
VRPSIIAGDMDRRDFTVNAIAVDLSPNRFGAIMDAHGGMDDLDNRVLAVLHDDSFWDDPTRLFRAVRYEVRHGLRMSMVTEVAFRRGIGQVRELSADRVRHELERVLNEQAPETILSRADEVGLLAAVLPNLAWTPAMTTALRSLKEPSRLLYLAMLASHLSQEDADALIARLNAPRTWATVITDTVALKDRLAEIGEEGLSSAGVHGALDGTSIEALEVWAALSEDALIVGSLRDYLDRLRHVHPMLDGDALLAMDVPQGPVVGELLRELLHARIEGLVVSRADEEALVRRRMSAWSGNSE